MLGLEIMFNEKMSMSIAWMGKKWMDKVFFMVDILVGGNLIDSMNDFGPTNWLVKMIEKCG